MQVGSVIAIIAEEGDDASGAAAMAEQASKQSLQEEKKPTESSTPEKSIPTSDSPSKPATESKVTIPSGDRIFASPIAKKIALERGIPLAKVRGSGPGGRIIRDDVEKYKSEAAAASMPPAGTLSQAEQLDYVDTPVSNMRRTIGARLTQSKQELPHYYLTIDINMDKVLRLREVFNKSIVEKDKSAKLSVNDFIVKAVACALADVPEANSAWLGEVIRTSDFSLYACFTLSDWIENRYKKADISIAVATPSGLITPIVKDAGSKGLASISAETKALARKAREGKLAPQEYQVRS